MTPSEALARLARVRDMAGDYEAAHGAEDDFRADVLQAIADGHPDPQALASVALQTAEIEFARWCA